LKSNLIVPLARGLILPVRKNLDRRGQRLHSVMGIMKHQFLQYQVYSHSNAVGQEGKLREFFGCERWGGHDTGRLVSSYSAEGYYKGGVGCRVGGKKKGQVGLRNVGRGGKGATTGLNHCAST